MGEPITREDIERIIAENAPPYPPPSGLHRLFAHALSEPARIEAARREMQERCARLVETQQETCHEQGGGTLRSVTPRKPGNMSGLAFAAAIRSLTPAPAEPSAPVAPQSRAELEAIRDASVAWKEDHATMESMRSRFPWLDKHYADETGVSDFKVIEARIAALEAENAKLREGLHDLLTRPTDGAARVRARALLQGQGGDDGKAV